jgi:MoxR-like ATPase
MKHFLEESFKNPFVGFTPAMAHSALKILCDQVLHDESKQKVVIGQDELLDDLVEAILVRGHCLLEGPPGVNKTRLAMSAASRLSLVFNRVQCTPDLVPSDLVWITTVAKDRTTGQLVPIEKAGKLFSNILIMDEINRASPKTHSATLEAMSEMQASPPTGATLRLRPREPYDEAELMRKITAPYFGLPILNPDRAEGQCFVVLATQNPLEHEGVYPLARAQEDRFMLKCLVDHQPLDAYSEMSRHAFEIEGNAPEMSSVKSDEALKQQQEEHVKTLYFLEAVRRQLLGEKAWDRWKKDEVVRPKVERLIYVTHLSREDAHHSRVGQRLQEHLSMWKQDGTLRQMATELESLIQDPEYPEVQSGSGVRGYFSLIRGAFTQALLNPRMLNCDNWSEVNPTEEDVAKVAFQALRHRIHLAPGARALGNDSDQIIEVLLRKLEIQR